MFGCSIENNTTQNKQTKKTIMITNTWSVLRRPGTDFCEVLSDSLPNLAGIEVCFGLLLLCAFLQRGKSTWPGLSLVLHHKHHSMWGNGPQHTFICTLTFLLSNVACQMSFLAKSTLVFAEPQFKAWQMACFVLLSLMKKSESSSCLPGEWLSVRLCKWTDLPKVSLQMGHLVWLICLEDGSAALWKWKEMGVCMKADHVPRS
jgi:hypothetical protein